MLKLELLVICRGMSRTMTFRCNVEEVVGVKQNWRAGLTVTPGFKLGGYATGDSGIEKG